MIHVENLTKSYRIDSGRHYVFRSVSAVFPENANIGIIGPNGGGKSTFLRLLGGIDHPDSGRILSNKSFSWPLGLKGGFVNHLSGRENCRMVCNLYGLPPRTTKRKLEEIKALSGIGKYFEEPVDYYSSGMGGRLGFALSMSFDFDYFLIDEITSVGDASFKELAKKTLEEKAKRSRVIMVSHNMGDLKKFCDVAVLVSGGQFQFFHNIDEAIRAYLPQTKESDASNKTVLRQATIDQINLDSISLPAGVANHLADIEQALVAIEEKLLLPTHQLPADESAFFHSLGQAYEQLGDRPKAKNYYERSVASNPYQLNSLLKLADFAARDNNYSVCEKFVDSAKLVDPKHLRVLIHSMRTHLRNQNFMAALEENDTALRVSPEHHEVWHLRSQIFANENRYSEAVDAQIKAIKAAPLNAGFYSYLSALLATQGEIKTSQLAAHKARLLRENPNPPLAADLTKLSRSLLKLNQSLKA